MAVESERGNPRYVTKGCSMTKKAWVYIKATNNDSGVEQLQQLTSHCEKANIEIVGVTKEIGLSTDPENSVVKAIDCARDRQCDYVAMIDSSMVDIYGENFTKYLDLRFSDGISLYSSNQGEFFNQIVDGVPLLRHRFAPATWFSVDDLFEEECDIEYPVKRNLDSTYIRLNRQGEAYSVCISDLCQDERLRVLQDMKENELRELCEKLITDLRFIGDIFDMVHSEDCGYSATVVSEPDPLPAQTMIQPLI